MQCLAMRFSGILRSKRSAPLDAWIDDAIDSELIPIMRFARVLRRDIDAVNNAIELPWSNGQAEGQINRLKTLKNFNRVCLIIIIFHFREDLVYHILNYLKYENY